MASTSRALFRKGVIALSALLALVAAAALSQPWWLGPLVAHQLSAPSGRSVHFDSIWVGLSGTFEPVVHCRGVRIENAAWADAKRPFADLKEVVAVLSWRSFAEDRPVIALLTLRDGEVDFERQADGLRNWRLRNPEDRSPGRVKILSARAERATVRFVHRGVDLELEAAVSANDTAAASGGAEGMPTRLDLKGAWRKVTFTASIATGEVLTFLETGRTFALRGTLEAGGARLEIDGRAGDIVRAPTIDARVSFAGRSLVPFQPFLGRRASEPKALRAEGHLKADDRAYLLSALKARVGATDLVGEIGFDRAEKRTAVRAKLQSESTDLADLLWLAGHGPEPRRETRAALPVSSAPFDLTRAREADADVMFEARHLHVATIPLLQSLKARAVLVDGQLAISGLDVGLAQGHATGSAALDMREPSLSAEGELAVRGVRIEALLPEQPESKRVTGALQAQARVKSGGRSVDALLANASGSVSATLTGGSISSLLDAEMGLQGGKILRSMLAGSEPIAIRCAAAAIDLRRGIGHVRKLSIDTERTRTSGTGTIGLTDRTLDLVLTPQAKQRGLFVLDRSIRLSGSLGKKMEHALVDRVTAAPGDGCAGS